MRPGCTRVGIRGVIVPPGLVQESVEPGRKFRPVTVIVAGALPAESTLGVTDVIHWEEVTVNTAVFEVCLPITLT